MSDISGNLNNNDNNGTPILEETILNQEHLEGDNLSQQNSLNNGTHSSLTDNNINPQLIDSSEKNQLVDNFSDVSSSRNDNNLKFDKFKYEYMCTRRNNHHILQESKESKRLLDLKYNDLVNIINNIQTSVIFTSTISGFLQATKEQFQLGEIITSVVSITIATYISLILSISKYYGLGELKERIQLLREKYSQLLNEIDYNMDILGPWSYKNRWRNSDENKLYNDWLTVYDDVSQRYDVIVSTKKELVTEYEDIMDTKSRNYYDIQNKKLNLKNREKMYSWEKAEEDLEQTIAQDKKNRAESTKLKQLTIRRGSIKLGTEELDNWSFDDWNSV